MHSENKQNRNKFKFCSHFNLLLHPSIFAASLRRTEFQVAKMWNSLLQNLKVPLGLMELEKEEASTSYEQMVSSLDKLLACLGQHISSQAMKHLASSSLPYMFCSFLQ